MEQIHDVTHRQGNDDNTRCDNLVLKNIGHMGCNLACCKSRRVFTKCIQNSGGNTVTQRFRNSLCRRLKCSFKPSFCKLTWDHISCKDEAACLKAIQCSIFRGILKAFAIHFARNKIKCKTDAKWTRCSDHTFCGIIFQGVNISRFDNVLGLFISILSLPYKIHSFGRIRNTRNLPLADFLLHQAERFFVLVVRNFQPHCCSVRSKISIFSCNTVKCSVHRTTGSGIIFILNIGSRSISVKNFTVCTIFSVVISYNGCLFSMQNIREIICTFCRKSMPLCSGKLSFRICLFNRLQGSLQITTQFTDSRPFIFTRISMQSRKR